MQDVSFKDLLQLDLSTVEIDGTGTRVVIPRGLLAWKRGQSRTAVVDTRGQVMDPGETTRVVQELLRREHWKAVETMVASHAARLADEWWDLGRGITSDPLIERFTRKVLHATSLATIDSASIPVQVLEDFTIASSFSLVETTIIGTIDRRVDEPERVKRFLHLLDVLAGEDENRKIIVTTDIATLLSGCKTAAQRRGFHEYLARHDKDESLIGALLKSGSNSEDIGIDVIATLASMNQQAVAAFIATPARVVHRNYLFRLTCVKSNQVTGKMIATAASILHHSNGWALARQFDSWKERISSKILDRQQVSAMISETRQVLERQRRAMTFAPEIAQRLAKKWRTMDGFPGGTTMAQVSLGDGEHHDATTEIPPAIVDFFQAAAGELTVIRVPVSEKPVPVVPLEVKNNPWVMLQQDVVIGLGMSGLQLRAFPAFLDDLPGLSFLDASNNDLSTGQLPGPLPALRYLDVSRNTMNMFEPGVALDALRFLDLHGNVVKRASLCNIAGELRVVDLSRNQLASMAAIEGLEACTKLGTLNIAWNKLGSLAGLPAMPSLVMLFAGGNGMVRLGAKEGTLPAMPSLRLLDLSDNNLGALKGIDAFPGAIHLDVSRNYIKHLKNVPDVKGLKTLLARDNQIETNEPIKGSSTLDHVDLQGNPLSDIPKALRARVLLASR